MRSNGVAHLGHDTFVGFTRDSSDSFYLFTSSFTDDERLATLPFSRRVRLAPSSSLDVSEADMTRCLGLFQRIQQQRAAAKAQAAAGPKDSADKNGNGVTVHSDSGQGCAASGDDDDGVLAQDDDLFSLVRHSIHVSCDGQRIAVMSNEHRRHYVFDVTREPVNVVEFETEEVVRSAVWHPTTPYLLLTLSVTGALIVYDTFVFNSSVVVQGARQTDLKPMLSVLLKNKTLMAQSPLGAGLKNRPTRDEASSLSEKAEKAASGKAEQRSGSSGTPPPIRRDGSSSTPTPSEASPIPSKKSGEGLEGNGAANIRGSSFKGGARSTTGQCALDGFGLPVRASPAADGGDAAPHHRGEAQRPSTLLADIHTSLSGSSGGPTVRRPASSPAVDQLAAAPLVGKEQPQQQRGAANRAEEVLGSDTSRVFATVFPGAVTHCSRSTLLPSSPESAIVKPGTPSPKNKSRTRPAIVRSAAEARALVALHPEDFTTTSVDLVDMCVVGPSLSLPPTLLLLSSSGDVFSVKLDPHCQPARGKAVAPDGSVPLTAAESEAAAEAKTAQEQMPHLCHVIQGKGRRRRVPKETNEARSPKNSHKSNFFGCAKVEEDGNDEDELGEEEGEEEEEEEEAVAVRCCRVDDDTGVHAVIVVYASGIIRGAWVDEADLIARHRAASVRADFAKYGASSFSIHLGTGLCARSFLSPMVPTTTHTVQLSAQGNTLLLRTGGGEAANEAAYLIAFPVLDRHRRGWSFWAPRDQVHSTERLRESLRLPLISVDAAIPEPLALRVPFNVHGASLAIGATELILFPECANANAKEGGGCPRKVVVTAKISSLLRSALYARSAGAHITPQLGWGSGSLETMVEKMFTCHKAFLCGYTPFDVDNHTAELASLVQTELNTTQQREAALAQREARLSERLHAALRRMRKTSDAVDAWTATLLDAIAHRRGPSAVHTANQRLGLTHEMLTEEEEGAAAYKRREAQRRRQQ